MTDGSWNWIESTEVLQKDYFNNDLRAMSGDDQDKHILYNFTAAVNELNEMLDEAPSWKPWSSEVGILNREAFRDEIVDVLHFVANLVILGKISEAELWDAYRAKQQRNRERMMTKGGYKASQNKCPVCKRELDKPEAYEMMSQRYHQEGDSHQMYYKLKCAKCAHEFDYMIVIGEGSLPGVQS
ncbi:MazG-like nucleotide pyrophosphohydrolase [Gordonia phage Sixama]|uniref:MazG-like nucleotide pyrophosphohydrolase n=1 Tax=Gordonia phage Sixama TaxID=2653271 RepID=A0A5Q2F219_9CAUD|nr:nucleoside triphosphate pyrophosphohydrolase [Gordonia phage Sixama]QGF20301.1 MazG-like nucleotide pyrophosphohydrolase [Gordonia phage Sixama]